MNYTPKYEIIASLEYLLHEIQATRTKTMSIILTTERLIIRTLEMSDIDEMTAISSDPKVMEYFPSLQDRSITEILIENAMLHQKEFGYSLFHVDIKETNEFIGFVGLYQPTFEIPRFTPHGLPIVEIGWRLAARHWGKGYAPEAAAAILHHAFTVFNLPEIISFTAAANLKSRRVMEKIGLHHNPSDDFAHPSLSDDSPLQHHVLYRLTRDEYHPSHSVFK